VAEEEILEKMKAPSAETEEAIPDEDRVVAKIIEEMKTLPSRVAERLVDYDESIRV
jgi:hypothetical protein